MAGKVLSDFLHGSSCGNFSSRIEITFGDWDYVCRAGTLGTGGETSMARFLPRGIMMVVTCDKVDSMDLDAPLFSFSRSISRELIFCLPAS